MAKEAGVYTARGIGELEGIIRNLAEQGFRIITVFEVPEGYYHVVAQQEIDTDGKSLQ
jgi:hypothetical protein